MAIGHSKMRNEDQGWLDRTHENRPFIDSRDQFVLVNRTTPKHQQEEAREPQINVWTPESPRCSDSTLLTGNQWLKAREYRRQVHELPQIHPHADSTIQDVEQNAEFRIGQLVLAMANIKDVKDREGSHSLKMFLPEAYDPLLLEATSREVFSALLDRCKHGFRGPAHFNKALSPRKGLEADKTATCEERLQNIIHALMRSKLVCKDVLYEDWKIMLLVNHPLAYDKEKDWQKGSNDQRRMRLLQERAKFKQTEDELRAYRQANPRRFMPGPGGDGNRMRYLQPERWPQEMLLEREEEEVVADANAAFAQGGNKRQRFEVDDAADVKRQRLAL